MTVLAGLQALLGRYSGAEDLAVGSPIANRNRLETEGLIGMFVNTLVLRGRLAGDPTFAELIARVSEATLAAYAHQDVPFEKLVEELEPERDLARNPLFQVLFVLQNAPMPALELPGLLLTPLATEGESAKFDLTLALAEAPTGENGGLAGAMEHSADLFDGATVRRLLGHLEILLRSAAADPSLRLSELPLLPPAERDQLLLEWNATSVARPAEALLHELFEVQVAARPEAVALIWNQQRISYRELDTRAERLAARLSTAGVGPEVRVGLLANRAPELVVGALGILKAGGAYVPLDPAYPRQRLAGILEDAGAPLVLVGEGLGDRLPGIEGRMLPLADDGTAGVVRRPADASPGRSRRLAYVIYTSGSTGRPKGVAIEHRSAVEMVRWAAEVFPPRIWPECWPRPRSASTSRSSSCSSPSPGAARSSWRRTPSPCRSCRRAAR